MSTTERTVLTVEGMTCGSCVRHVQQALEELIGVSTVVVSLPESKAVVDHQPGVPGTEALLDALREAGYDCGVKSSA
ncbi:MAG TPA: heavy metal-associated domain-containing protein [Polyangiaceae bacterium]